MIFDLLVLGFLDEQSFFLVFCDIDDFDLLTNASMLRLNVLGDDC